MITPVYYANFLVGEMISAEGYGSAYGAGGYGLGRGIHFRYQPEIVEPWFANLLPEEANLTAVARALGAAKGDVEKILGAIGGDTAGALSFGTPSDREIYE